MAQQPLINGDTFGVQRSKINANDADNAAAATAAQTAAAAAASTATAAQGAATAASTAAAAAQAAVASAVKTPTAWAASASGGTPALSSGTAVLGTAFKNTTAGTTTLLTPIDGITQVGLGDLLVCLTAGAYTYCPAGGAYLGVFGSAGALPTPANNAGNFALAAGAVYFCNGSTWGAAGGASTLSSLSDVGSYDLSTNNPSVAAIKAAVTGLTVSSVSFATAWDMTAFKDMGEQTITAALALTSVNAGALPGRWTECVLIADGVHVPTFDGSTNSNWNNTAGVRNRVELRCAGSSKFWAVSSSQGTVIVQPANAAFLARRISGSAVFA